MRNQMLIPASRIYRMFRIQDKANTISLMLPLHGHCV